MAFIQRLLVLLRRGVTGGSYSREMEHPFFGTMTYFELQKEAAGPYWEAEVPIEEAPGRVSVTLRGTADGPTESEVAFCWSTVADLDGLFERCRSEFRQPLDEWASRPMPQDWRSAFEIDGFSVPEGGDPAGKWDVCYFVTPANHWFTACFDGGEVVDVYVDG